MEQNYFHTNVDTGEKMKFLIKIILIVTLAYFIQPFAPWWVIIVIPFVISVAIKSDGFAAFFSGFLGVGALWLWKSWTIDQETNAILTSKIAALFSIPETIYLILITAFLGGLAAGFGSLSGYTFKKLFEKKKRLYY